MNTELKNQILRIHNVFRNKIALGQEPPFRSAKRMAQMVWNHELAWLAELNTKQCKMSHDKCRNTARFEYSGQNLGEMGTSGPHHDPSTIIDRMITNWYNEYQYATQSDIDNFTKTAGQNK